ncbi:hypothetical protein C455_08742 [Haloferax larsenii JCM 13917]|nr:hypothetical protein [Haloferax larsenii]ELZ79659.1 hypothetical protein C455_08742 [Haloferax larsenii JCM 13917]
MKAKIIDEDDQGVGVRVRDNKGSQHTVAVGFDGEIQGHSQDGYPDDPDHRTDAEKIYIQQAANYARYYVYRKQGYDTFDPLNHRNPDRLALAALVVGALPTDAFEAHFGDLYQQLKSEYTEQEPVVDVHEALQDDDAFMLYAKELYLGLDEGILDDLIDATSEDSLDAYLEDVARLSADAESGAAGIFEDLDRIAADHGVSAATDPSDWVEAVSGVHVQWRVGTDQHREENEPCQLDRDPDATLEIIPYNPESLDEFQSYVVHHLHCQVRDQLVEMGVTPPAPFQVQGPGADISTMIQQHYDGLQPYHDPYADIDWSALEPQAQSTQ